MATPETKPSRDNTHEQLGPVQEECKRLREENARLRAMLGIEESGGDRVAPHDNVSPAHSSKLASNLFTPEGKITLFQSLFRRRDVYAIRWEGKGGKSGYSPAAAMDWRAINAARQEERKRIARKTRILLPLTSDVIRKHLTGKHTVGMYPLLPDETCWFLAVDFDKKSWMADSTMCILNLCLLASLDVAVTCEPRNRLKHARAMQSVDPWLRPGTPEGNFNIVARYFHLASRQPLREEATLTRRAVLTC